MMRLAFVVPAVLIASLLSAACDSTTRPPPPGRPWTLDTCVNAAGPEAFVVGLDALACVSRDGLAEAQLDTAGFTGGESYVFPRGDELLLVFDRADFSGVAYRLDLRNGATTRLSVSDASDSQIARAGHGDADRYLVTDYRRNAVPSEDARFVFTWVEAGVARRGLEITVPDVGFVRFRDTDYDPVTNRSVHLFSAQPEDPDADYEQYLMLVDHAAGTYALELIPNARAPQSTRFLADGTLLVVDLSSGMIHAVLDAWRPVLDLSGQPDEVTTVRLEENRAGDVFTFTSAGGGTRVLRFLPGGEGTEEVLRLPEPHRVMTISQATDAFCFRTFRPFGWAAPTYADTIRVVAGGTAEAWPVTLRTDTHEAPRLSCR